MEPPTTEDAIRQATIKVGKERDKANLILSIGIVLCLIGLCIIGTQSYLLGAQLAQNQNTYIKALNEISSRCPGATLPTLTDRYMNYTGVP